MDKPLWVERTSASLEARKGRQIDKSPHRFELAKYSALRYHKVLGLIRVSLVGMRYFDRGAGGFMAGGAWVYEARVACATYPEVVEGDEDRIPEIRSVAGWGFAGDAPSGSGKKVKVADRRPSRPEVVSYERLFGPLTRHLTMRMAKMTARSAETHSR